VIPIDAVCRASAGRRSVLVSLVAIAALVVAIGGCRSTAQPEGEIEIETTVASDTEWLPLEVVTATRLNVRTGPGTEYELVGALIQGEQVRVIEESNGWKLVRPDGDELEGWVAGEYLQSLPTP
jgi:uncharacterized protein YgiM (DUF1202 family)